MNFSSYMLLYVNVVCCTHIRNRRFGHGTEEDSHEALRYLLSALRQEEIKVRCQHTMFTYTVTMYA